ncbi:hypothetical protein BTUL_0115g00080 [Botrytis tulipae]|uniref:Proliferating cell nuclear antigen n=1 Tax=Botrytis tulipae TaxID=87230 RepID=A0A4Z1EJ85_9HELO|nr:hypothetical protein BTUL_0115g00080 [Botrytis tulipae]
MAFLATPEIPETIKDSAYSNTPKGQEDNVEASYRPYVESGLKGIIASPYVAGAAVLSTVGGLLFGYDQGVVSVVLVMESFVLDFPRIGPHSSGFWKGILTAMIELGAFFGALNQGWIADKYSRRYSMLIAVVIFLLGSILQTTAVNFNMLVIARLVGGIGIEELSIVVGIVVAFWISFGTRYIGGEWGWRLPFFIQIVPALFLGAGVYFLPFSPRWLSSKGRDNEALRVLSKLRELPDSDSRIQEEARHIRNEVSHIREIHLQKHENLINSPMKFEIALWKDCFASGSIKRTHIGILIMFFQQFVGINALIYYSPTLFARMGLGSEMQLIMSGVLNICQLVGVGSSLFTMDRYGRRPLLIIGSFFMTISHVMIAVMVCLFSYDWHTHQAAAWVSVAFLLFYMVVFGASWGPVPWAMPSEIFRSDLRAKGVALSTCSNWLSNFIIGLITPPLVVYTNWGAYVFFGGFCALSGIWTWLSVPETKGLLEARLEQADLLKKVVDAIKDLVQDCNFDCNDSGIALQAMDNSHVALVSMMLKAEGFSPYRCDRNVALGVNLTSLTKVLRAAQNEDILTIKAEDAPDVLNLVFESSESDRLSEYDLKLMDIDQEHLGIPDTEYAAVINMPSSEFKRICVDLMALSESVSIEASKDGVKFSCAGDIGNGAVTLRSHSNVDKPDLNVDIELTEPVSLTFSLKYLVNFCKAAGLSKSVKLCLSNEVPLLVEYQLAGSSYLRFYLAPKIGDDE